MRPLMAENISTRSCWLREPWISSYHQYERPVVRGHRKSGDDTAEVPTTRPVGEQLRHNGTNREADINAQGVVTQESNCTKDEFSKLREYAAGGKLISIDKSNDISSVSGKKTEQRQARRRRRRRKRKVQRTHREWKSNSDPSKSHRPLDGHADALKEAGLPSKRLWSYSQRNKARRIARREAEPDESRLMLFDLRTGVSEQTTKKA